MEDKHHYVSQFHLRHFLDPDSTSTRDPWVWVGDLATKTVKRRAPKNFAWKRGMFKGPGGLADTSASLESHLANKIEPAAARAICSICKAPRGTPRDIPAALMRYIAWAAVRSLPMTGLFQEWIDFHSTTQLDIIEPPPAGWEKIQDRCRLHCMEHAEFGLRENVPTDQVSGLIEHGWKLKLNRDDLLELMHGQAWYFQKRIFPRLRWLVLEAPEDKWFVIGDRPVVWGFSGALAVEPRMLRHPNVQLFAPLSRSVALFAHHAASAPPDTITPERVNSAMAAAAVEWVAGSNEDTVQSVVDSIGFA